MEAIDGSPRTRLTVEMSDGVCHIRFATNTFSLALASELRAALGEIARDERVRALVLSGDGRDLCAGAHLTKDGFERMPPGTPEVDPVAAVGRALRALNVPTIVAMHGAVVGAGATLALSADVRIAGPAAQIVFPFVRLGIAAEGGAHWLLPRLVGASRATDWLVTGRPIDASEALAAGLVSAVDDDPAAAATRLAGDIVATTSPVAVAAIRRLLRRATNSMLAEIESLEASVLSELVGGPDASEGVAAFLARRPANFRSTPMTPLPAVLQDASTSSDPPNRSTQ